MNDSESHDSQLQDLDFFWNPSDPLSSEGAYRKQLEAARSAPEKNQGKVIELLSLLARAQSVQGKISESRDTLAAAQKLLEDPSEKIPVAAKIRWLLEFGRVQILEKTPSQARPRFLEAWTLATHSGEDYLAVDVALMMAAIEPQKLQTQWILRATELAEKSPQSTAKRWLGSLYSAYAWKLFDLRQYENAIATFQKSLSHLKANGTDREVFVAKWSIGKLLRIMGRTEEALSIQNALLAELGIGGKKDGRLFEELAECLHKLKRTPEAQTYFELAYRELSNDEWVNDNQPLALKRLKDLGKVKGSSS